MRLRLLNLAQIALVLVATGLPAHASRDIVQFGSNIEVGPDTSTHDTVCFFCSVIDRGTVEGDIVVFFGNVRIEGHAKHDVVNFFGNVSAEDDSSIGQDLVAMFGTVHLGERVAIGKDVVSLFGTLRAPGSVTVGGDRVVQPAWFFWAPSLVFVLVFLVLVHEYRNYRRRRLYLRGYPFPPR